MLWENMINNSKPTKILYMRFIVFVYVINRVDNKMLLTNYLILFNVIFSAINDMIYKISWKSSENWMSIGITHEDTIYMNLKNNRYYR